MFDFTYFFFFDSILANLAGNIQFESILIIYQIDRI